MKSNNITQNTKKINSPIVSSNNDNEMEAKVLVLETAGYPFNFGLLEGSNLEISDKVLFEHYAKEQWLGLSVQNGSYLFDQKIIPDYAFKVVTVYPDNSIISENTSIVTTEKEKTDKNIESIDSNLKISDIVGQANAKRKSKVIMKYLENPEKFGDWAPKNILFYGFPGTGKTMLVKALANEVDVPLYLIKATSLIGDHVGDGSNRIHELFELAQKTAPSIIFIDEIDAVALHRSFQSLRGDVSEIVNSLLTEMDGINLNKGIITIGATNNPSSLDYAIRSRFEEEIEFELPNEEDRKELFKSNLNKFPLDHNLDFEKLINLSKRMSGRDIKEKLLKTAIHNAIANDKAIVTMEDIDFALKLNKQKANEVKGMFE